MKKLGKILVGVFAVVILLIVVLVVAVGIAIDTVAKTAVEKGGTYATGVSTTVDAIDVGLMAGTLDIQGLNIANPEGFDAFEQFFYLGDADFALEAGSIQAEVIEVPKLALDNVVISIEQQEDNANYQVIMDNLAKLSEQGPPAEETEESGSSQKFVIRELSLTNIKANLKLTGPAGLLGEQTVNLPAIQMQDVGTGADGGVQISQLIGIILDAVMQGVVENVAGGSFDAIASGLDEGLGQLENLSDLGGDVLTSVGDSVNEALESGDLNKAAEDVGKTLEDAGKEVENAVEELGNLFNQDE